MWSRVKILEMNCDCELHTLSRHRTPSHMHCPCVIGGVSLLPPFGKSCCLGRQCLEVGDRGHCRGETKLRLSTRQQDREPTQAQPRPPRTGQGHWGLPELTRRERSWAWYNIWAGLALPSGASHEYPDHTSLGYPGMSTQAWGICYTYNRPTQYWVVLYLAIQIS